MTKTEVITLTEKVTQLRAAVRLAVAPYYPRYQKEYIESGRLGPIISKEDITTLSDILDILSAIETD